jgi:hypothetical protein
MLASSTEIIRLLSAFAPQFTAPAFAKMTDLFCGVVLSPGKRTVTAALRAIGFQDEKTFGKYHRFLSRDRWSALCLSGILLLLLLQTFLDENQPVELVVDETLERRQGAKIQYKGWFRDAVRSTASTTVTTKGIRWLCVCLLVRVPWSKRRWALPFFTVPSCSQTTCQKRGRPHCGSSGWTIDCMLKVREWVGSTRPVHLIGDGGFTNAPLIDYNRSLGIVQIGRLRLDAALYDLPLTAEGGIGAKKKPGPKALKGKRQANLAQRLTDTSTSWATIDVAWYGSGHIKSVEIVTGVSLWYVPGNPPIPLRWVLVRSAGGDKEDVKTGNGKDGVRTSRTSRTSHAPRSRASRKGAAAFFSTDVNATAEQIIASYADRWNIEVFFEEVRACLGFETQRGWSNKTIGRTTPCLFGVFSLVVIQAQRLYPTELPIRQAAWYQKDDATFRDVLRAVREHLWQHRLQHPSSHAGSADASRNTIGSSKTDDLCAIPRSVLAALQEVACYAA